MEYANYRVFVCDDSTDPVIRARVDAFVRHHRDRCTLIRRANRLGFKAGNLNNALTQVGAEYEYLLLVDNDSIIDPAFIRAALCRFQGDESVAFVQACHQASDGHAQTSFSRAIALGVACMWRFVTLKNRYGMPPMLGHGALLRRDLVRKVGGFPERVSEDLVLTVRLRALGYRGVVSDDVWCQEGVPSTFAQYRRRFEKWILGSVEFICKDGRGIFFSGRIPAAERLDLAVSVLSLLNVVALFGFLVLGNVVWPLTVGTWGKATIESHILGLSLRIPMLHSACSPIDSVGLGTRLIVIVGTMAPLVYFAQDFGRHPLQTLRHISTSFTCFCAMLVPATLSLTIVLLTQRYECRGTGDVAELRRFRNRAVAANLYVGRLGSLIIEVVVGSAVCVVAGLTGNMFLAAISLGILIAPLLDVFGWGFRPLMCLRHAPFALLVLQMVYVALPEVGGFVPFTSGLVLIHF